MKPKKPKPKKPCGCSGDCYHDLLAQDRAFHK